VCAISLFKQNPEAEKGNKSRHNKKKTVMKTKLSAMLIAAMFIMATQPAHAKIRRVGYWGTPITNTDYTDLQSAHDAAAAGDTLLIFPGSWSATYSKKLVTLGYGYFIDTSGGNTAANPGLQNIKGALSISIILAAGSNNCTFEGLDGFTISTDGTGTTISGVIVRRCYGNVYLYNANVYNNWQVLQCYLYNLYLGESGSTVSISNLTVNNCYVYQMAGYTGITNQTGQFNNCVFYSAYFNDGAFVVKNSIILSGRYQDEGTLYQNCLFNTDYNSVPSGTGNIGTDNGTMSSNVFVGWQTQGSFSNDGMWALKAGSPAKGTGAGGTDMGIFGGTNPYKLSGMPRIPAIYKLTAPSNFTSGTPYTITLSVRSNN
jgi:hypothetical protein